MNLNISFKQMSSSDALKFYTKEKSDKLAIYFNGRISVTWTFSVEKLNKIAHCHLVGNNMDYFSDAETADMHASIDLVIEKLEKQIRKHKEIVKDHLHKNGHRLPATSTG